MIHLPLNLILQQANLLHRSEQQYINSLHSMMNSLQIQLGTKKGSLINENLSNHAEYACTSHRHDWVASITDYTTNTGTNRMLHIHSPILWVKPKKKGVPNNILTTTQYMHYRGYRTSTRNIRERNGGLLSPRTQTLPFQPGLICAILKIFICIWHLSLHFSYFLYIY